MPTIDSEPFPPGFAVSSLIVLLREIPNALRFALLFLFVGVVLAWVGYLDRDSVMSLIGLGCLGAGLGISLADLFCRKSNRTSASEFHAGLLISGLCSVPMIVLLVVVGALVYLVRGFLDGFSSAQALRLLHFTAVMYATVVVISIPRFAESARSES